MTIRQDRTLRSVAGMTSVPEISLVPLPASVETTAGEDAFEPSFSAWKPVEIPPPRRPSPIPLVVLALVAGVAAMALGGVAVVMATRTADGATPPRPASTPAKVVAAPTPKVERQALALLAKPSTERVVFRGSGGRLVLVVGSGGRAAILVRGFERAPEGWPYYAWVVRDGKIVRAARFTGAERAVFLTPRVRRTDSVVVAPDRAAALRPRSARIVALRG